MPQPQLRKVSHSKDVVVDVRKLKETLSIRGVAGARSTRPAASVPHRPDPQPFGVLPERRAVSTSTVRAAQSHPLVLGKRVKHVRWLDIQVSNPLPKLPLSHPTGSSQSLLTRMSERAIAVLAHQSTERQFEVKVTSTVVSTPRRAFCEPPRVRYHPFVVVPRRPFSPSPATSPVSLMFTDGITGTSPPVRARPISPSTSPSLASPPVSTTALRASRRQVHLPTRAESLLVGPESLSPTAFPSVSANASARFLPALQLQPVLVDKSDGGNHVSAWDTGETALERDRGLVSLPTSFSTLPALPSASPIASVDSSHQFY